MGEIVFLLVVWWLTFAGFSGYLAEKKGKNFVSWMVLGFLFGPIAFLAVGLVPAEVNKVEGSVCPQCGRDLSTNHAVVSWQGQANRRICLGAPTAHQLNELRLALTGLEQQKSQEE